MLLLCVPAGRERGEGEGRQPQEGKQQLLCFGFAERSCACSVLPVARSMTNTHPGNGHWAAQAALGWTWIKGGPWARGCSEQAPGDASAPTDPTDPPKIPQGTAGTGECRHGLFAEGLRQQFPLPSSHTPASYVPATQNAFPSSLRTSSLSSVKAKASFPHSNEMPSNALRDAFK